MNAPQKRLYRSRSNRVIAGVCGGLGDYTGIDPTIIRVVWALVTIFTALFGGLIAYLVLALVVPEEPTGQQNAPAPYLPPQPPAPPQQPPRGD